MNINHTKMTLEINSCKNYEILEVRQGDKGSRIIDFAFTVNGETVELTSTMSAKVNATVDDVIVADSVAAVVDTENNVVTVTLTDTMLALSGVCKMDIVLTEGDEIITAETVCLRVGKSVINDDSKAFPGASSIVEITKEVENARGGQNSLGARLDTVDANLTKKADKTNTLAGYGIINAYTKTEMLNLLASKADKSTTLAGYGITDALQNAKGTVSTNNLADNCVSSNKLSADVRANINSKAESAKVSQQLLLKADASSVYTKSESDALLKVKANSADVDASIKTINTTIANNQKSVNASLESFNTALINKADTDVVNEVKQRAESNTTAIGLKVNRTDFNKTVTNLTNSINEKADKADVDTSLANKANLVNSSNIFDFNSWAKGLQGLTVPIYNGTLNNVDYNEKSISFTTTKFDAHTSGWSSTAPQSMRIAVKPNTKYLFSWLPSSTNCGAYVFLNGVNTNDTRFWLKSSFASFTTAEDTTYILIRFDYRGTGFFKVSEIMITEKESIYLPNKVAEGVPEVANEVLTFEKTTQTSLDGKYDSSNIELGTATLTPYSTQIDKIKSATCLYEKIGDIVIVNVTVIMNETSLGGTSSISLLNMPFSNKSDVIVHDIGISKNGGMFRANVTKSAWLQFTLLNKQAYDFVADEQVNFSLIYKI